jgi:[ribosomal protein S18]-alanine N-acetyltransferase
MSAPRLWAGSVWDAELLARLHALSLADPWPREAFASLLSGSEIFVLLAAKASGAAEGFILVRAIVGEAEVLTFCVVPPARRHGVGKALLDAACAAAQERGAEEIFLEVGEDNAAARALYDQSGFKPVGRRAAYYRHGPEAADAIVMRKALAVRVE